jgi:Asp-tRNA(Asn)/Glu-tRNA(Gln) amidotransferase A subunit family amidase
VQLVERPFNDAGLIRLAAQIEAAAPWAGRHPTR